METNSRQRTNFLVFNFSKTRRDRDTEAERDLQDSDVGYIWFVRDFIFGQVHACFDHFVIIVIQTIQKRRQTTTDTSFIE